MVGGRLEVGVGGGGDGAGVLVRAGGTTPEDRAGARATRGIVLACANPVPHTAVATRIGVTAVKSCSTILARGLVATSHTLVEHSRCVRSVVVPSSGRSATAAVGMLLISVTIAGAWAAAVPRPRGDAGADVPGDP
jgi:hypothetical protein